MAWQGQILRVNLSDQSISFEALNQEWAQSYLGQRGIASKYLLEEMDPAADALSPENKLIFATGPLTGTMASTGGRYSVVCKGALTNAIACSNSGGMFGAELKFAGYDMVIFEGRATEPVYLYINDDQVELISAKHLWGKTVWETEPALKSFHQNASVKVASIGPAGEKGNRFACVVNDLHRAASRSGVGAAMGSKNLKAIVVEGSKGVTVSDPSAFMQTASATKAIMQESADRKALTREGTLMMMDIANTFGTLPTRNFREVQFEGADKINVETMHSENNNEHRNIVQNGACFGCTIGCGRICHIDPEHFSVKDKPQYHGASGGLEYETAFSLGSTVGVSDMNAATYCGFLCNEYGMDPISLGGSIAAAMELFDTGVISEKDTGGITLNFGSAEALVAITEATARGEGFGIDVGLGSKRLCEKYAHPEFSMAVKGQEFAGYDGRSMQGMGLAYATSNRGACHLRAAPYEDDFETTEPESKAQIVKDSQDYVAAVDSSGLCLFPGDAGLDEEAFTAHINAACEGDWDLERLKQTGERIWNLERQFNLAAGLDKSDDTLPQRILKEPAPSGSAKGLVCRLDEMLPAYYELRGWDGKGVPYASTLQRLGLSE
ncbi:MAG: aldehyde ferredoxin oxidoreductase [Gammaproteobacteria bacterium]|nr:aldehyde ferredoxin oxidoreductase [Gammaproteobacteria bacterium]